MDKCKTRILAYLLVGVIGFTSVSVSYKNARSVKASVDFASAEEFFQSSGLSASVVGPFIAAMFGCVAIYDYVDSGKYAEDTYNTFELNYERLYGENSNVMQWDRMIQKLCTDTSQITSDTWDALHTVVSDWYDSLSGTSIDVKTLDSRLSKKLGLDVYRGYSTYDCPHSVVNNDVSTFIDSGSFMLSFVNVSGDVIFYCFYFLSDSKYDSVLIKNGKFYETVSSAPLTSYGRALSGNTYSGRADFNPDSWMNKPSSSYQVGSLSSAPSICISPSLKVFIDDSVEWPQAPDVYLNPTAEGVLDIPNEGVDVNSIGDAIDALNEALAAENITEAEYAAALSAYFDAIATDHAGEGDGGNNPSPSPTPKPDEGGGGGDGGDTPSGKPSGGSLTADLKKIFPFCIPFDFMVLIGLLKAEKQTPYIEIPIKIKQLGVDEVIIIDFSQYEYVGSVSRTMFLVLFIFGLFKFTKMIKW